MGTEENVAASAGDQRDDLETINGIGSKWADALHRTGIRRFEDLAQYTPHSLAKALLDQVGVKVPPERIATKGWISQAKALAQESNPERTPPEEQAEGAKEPEAAPNHPAWRQHAGFSVFFDYATDEHGEQVWQTRVYHNESGEETPFSGIETAPWVDWVLERANLPAAPEPTPTETEVAAPAMPYGAQLEILDVQVSKIKPSPDLREKKLKAEVRFQISGPKAEALTTERVPVHIEVHTVNLESKALNLVVSEWSQLQPGVFEYAIQQAFPIPELGRYQLRSIVLLPPPGETMAFHRGPTLKVVP